MDINAKVDTEGNSRFRTFEICKQVVSFLGSLGSIWRQPDKDGNAEEYREEAKTCPILEKYNVTQDLCLIWAVDIVVKDSLCIQVLKIWDILPFSKIDEMEKDWMEKVYGNYTKSMMNRCKEKCVQGNLTLPITWPVNMETDSSWSLVNQLAAMSLRNQHGSGSSSASRVSVIGGGL
uniref:uncharacterized protein LOC122605973 n=1 Tax=Erigeron canadensis TaxID=72917 RepID=UPI001CB973C9|nr:uncharacterized protein LOC122605973 [Erigeron canadensis]